MTFREIPEQYNIGITMWGSSEIQIVGNVFQCRRRNVVMSARAKTQFGVCRTQHAGVGVCTGAPQLLLYGRRVSWCYGEGRGRRVSGVRRYTDAFIGMELLL